MTQELRVNFLEQFSNSKNSVSSWPTWMRESSTVAVASLPRTVDKERLLDAEVPETTQAEKPVD